MPIASKDIIDSQTQKNIDSWLEGDYDAQTKEKIQGLLKDSPQKLIDAFYTNLSFGTGGLRGLMGVGCNRMNEYTVRAATQGFANYLLKSQKSKEKLAVAIGYDSRENSKFFAEQAARVLAGNHIQVHLSSTLRATPLVSFACRHYECQAAIVITASHNPKEYNGFKAYWNDGAQVLPPHDEGIIEEVHQITSPSQVRCAPLDSPLIQLSGKELDKAYLQAVQDLQLLPEQNSSKGKELRVIYTPLHGTGITIVPPTLKNWGFSDLLIVKEQEVPNGEFPTVAKPNPEEEEAMTYGVQQLLKEKGDLLLGTDPDTDRMGVVVRHQGKPVFLSGNQISCILLQHICETLCLHGRMPKEAAFISTIVSSDLFLRIAESFTKPCFEVLTGFKYIAQLIRQWESSENAHTFIFGAEESFGYLLGTHVRDKDGPTACALMCEVALNAKLSGKTLVDLLEDLYKKHGVYAEILENLQFSEGKEGRDKMQQIMRDLRKSPPQQLAGFPIHCLEDYLLSEKTCLITNEKTPLDLPSSDVLIFRLSNGSKIAIRPSGTEPKVKIYCCVRENNNTSVEEGKEKCKAQAEALLKELKKLL